ncbi:MAG: type II toxin-antitoxin system VapB family antitoxin [Verrucomicrobiae bacterium]|nr:type II toxin-antitoxin system VapB family antitoxin [Verrucomicrobiae bacterium]
MRTTLNLDNALIEEAQSLTGIKEKTALIHQGLNSLIQQESARRLAMMGGTDRKAKAGRRRRYHFVKRGA